MVAEIFHWDPTFDWVAVGTLALAAVTYVLARRTAKSVAVSQRAVAASERELSYSQRPVIAPETPGKWTGETDGQRVFHVWFANVGPGPALNITTKLQATSPAGVDGRTHP